MSSSQNERTLVGGGVENKQGQTKGEGRVQTRESLANIPFEWPLEATVQSKKALKYWDNISEN